MSAIAQPAPTADVERGAMDRKCLFCSAELTTTFVDLGVQPPCNAVVTAAKADQMEPFFPLHAYVCGNCFLVQVGKYVSPEGIFSEYSYFSSFSDSWLEHARNYVEMAASRFRLSRRTIFRVLERASRVRPGDRRVRPVGQSTRERR